MAPSTSEYGIRRSIGRASVSGDMPFEEGRDVFDDDGTGHGPVHLSSATRRQAARARRRFVETTRSGIDRAGQWVDREARRRFTLRRAGLTRYSAVADRRRRGAAARRRRDREHQARCRFGRPLPGTQLRGVERGDASSLNASPSSSTRMSPHTRARAPSGAGRVETLDLRDLLLEKRHGQDPERAQSDSESHREELSEVRAPRFLSTEVWRPRTVDSRRPTPPGPLAT